MKIIILDRAEQSVETVAKSIQHMLDQAPLSNSSTRKSMSEAWGDDLFKNLTTREIQVLSHLIQGCSNHEISTSLNIKIPTVKLHMRGICAKLGARNRTQAALIAYGVLHGVA